MYKAATAEEWTEVNGLTDPTYTITGLTGATSYNVKVQADCESEGTSPEIPYKGSLNVRFKNKDINRRAAIYALSHDMSLNSFIEEAVAEKLSATVL